MFLGKCGKNKLEGKDDLVEIYKVSSTDTMYGEVMIGDNYDNFMTT